eukprot:749235-Hanusia_phi.AAC.2
MALQVAAFQGSETESDGQRGQDDDIASEHRDQRGGGGAGASAGSRRGKEDEDEGDELDRRATGTRQECWSG